MVAPIPCQPDTVIAHPDPRDQRRQPDRRERALHGLLAGHWMRRRRDGRRTDDMHAAGRDWHEAHWLGAAVVILLLSVADAFATLTLMRHGAEEANPLMAPLIAGGGAGFAYWKVGLTAFGVVILTAFARIRLFRVIPVGAILYLVATGYIVLVAYELRLLHEYGADFVSYWLCVPLQLAA